MARNYVFSANDGTNGIELWVTDDTTGGTTLLKNINPNGDSSPTGFTALPDDRLVFAASDGTTGNELWVTDGTTAGTVLLKDINAGSGSSNPTGFTRLGNGRLVFSATTSLGGTELWVTDGTAAGTIQLSDINVGPLGSNPTGFTKLDDGRVLFSATTAATGTELYVTDGTTGGTTLLKDINPSAASSNPTGFTRLPDGRFVFSATTALGGTELYVTDGTTAGTTLLSDINAGVGSSNPSGFTALADGRLVFSATTPSTDRELFVTDGTAAGTKLLKDINKVNGSSNPSNFARLPDGRLVFSANDGVAGNEVWVTDGTTAGTVLLKDIFPGSTSGDPSGFTALPDGRLVFASLGPADRELYVTDGTAAGTVLLKDISLIAGARTLSSPMSLTQLADGRILFSADNGITGRELWVTDGTTGGTVQLQDIDPGSAASNPTGFTLIPDTIAPVAPAVLALAASSDSGVVGDGITNVNKPTFTGTAEANSLVTLRIDGVAVGTTTATAAGTYRFLTPTVVADGSHAVTATATDQAGNVSVVSPAFALTIISTGPAAPVITAITPATDTGVAGDRITAVTAPTFVGTAVAGGTVTLKIGTVVLGTTVANAAGQFSLTPTAPLPSGASTVRASVTDTAGNVSALSNLFVVTIDNTAPNAPVIGAIAPGSDSGTLGDGITNVTTPTLTGTAEANSTVTVSFDGVVAGTTLADSTGAYSFTPTAALADGTHAATATSTDAAGNVSAASASFPVTVVATGPAAPVVAMLAPTSDSGVLGDRITNDSTPTVTGTAQANSLVTVLIDGVGVGTTTANASGQFSFTPPKALAMGVRTVTATATDAAGNVSAVSAPLSLTIDLTSPAAPVVAEIATASDSGVVGDRVTNVTKPTLTGTAEANSTVRLFIDGAAAGTATADANGLFAFTPTTALVDGPHSVTATSTDAAGNVSLVSPALGITVDTTAPAAPAITSIAASSDSGVVGDRVTNDTTPTLVGTAEANSTVTIRFDGVVAGTAIADATGAFSFTPATALGDGLHSATATATDVAGNVSVVSSGFGLTIVGTGPSVPVVAAIAVSSDSGLVGDGITNDNTPTLTGTAQALTTVTVSIDGAAVGSVAADAAGNYSFTPTVALGEGVHSVTATATDLAGNMSAVSAPFSVTVDTVGVAMPAILGLLPNSDSGVVGDGITNVSTPTLTGTAEALSTVTVLVDGVPVGTTAADAAGTFAFTPTTPIAQGTHGLTAFATDKAGNVSPASIGFSLTIDSVGPDAPVVTALAAASDSGVAGDLITNDTTPTLTGTAEANSTVTLQIDGAVVGTTVADATGVFSFTPTVALAEGARVVTATATDAAGSTSALSGPLTVTIDTTPPATPIALAIDAASDSGIVGDYITNDTTPALVGKAEPNATIVLTDTSGPRTVIVTTVADANGNYTFVPTAPLPEGVRTVSITATDAAGNVSAPLIPHSITIDITGPVAPVVAAIAPATDTGVVGDGITSNTKPTFTGTAEAGSTVAISVDGLALGSTVANAAGQFSFTPVTPLAQGDRSITATATDVAGNVSVVSAPLAVTIDATAPPAPVVAAIALTSDSGVVGDHITNDTTPTLTGTAEANSVVTVSIDGVAAGTAVADATGAYVFTPVVALAQGAHVATATAMDAAGNVSAASAGFGLTITAVGPAAPVVSAIAPGSDSGTVGDGITNARLPTLTGTAAPGSTVAVQIDGVAAGTVVAGPTGAFSFTPTTPLADGVRAITATATDAAGNVSAVSAPLAVTIDATAPLAPVVAAIALTSDSGVVGDHVTNDTTPTLTGTAEANSVVTVSIDGAAAGTAVADASGAYSFTPAAPLANGGHAITATATDAAGNVSAASASFALTVDTIGTALTAGLATDTGTPGDGITSDPTITGFSAPGATVTFAEGESFLGTAVADASGQYRFTPTGLAATQHSVTASSTDAAGNTTTTTVSFVLTAPDPTNYTLRDGAGVLSEGVLALSGPDQPGIVRNFTYQGLPGATLITRADGVHVTMSSGNDAVQVQGGRNILDGNGGSDWLVGGTGLDSYIVDARGSTWSSVLNFSAGEDLVIRGIDVDYGHSTMAWVANDGQAGYTGATLRGLLLGTQQAFSITFAGVSLEDAKRFSSFTDRDVNGVSQLHLRESSASAPDDATYGINTATVQGGVGQLDAYTGTEVGLRYQHIEVGNAPTSLVAHASDTLLQTGSGADTLVVLNGDNVLDGGGGSNWLVGGAGNDTFRVTAATGGGDWSTVLNFHSQDLLQIRGFVEGVSTWSWTTGPLGQTGYEGATLRGALNGHDQDFSVTLAGVSVEQAHGFSVTTSQSAEGVGQLVIRA